MWFRSGRRRHNGKERGGPRRSSPLLALPCKIWRRSAKESLKDPVMISAEPVKQAVMAHLAHHSIAYKYNRCRKACSAFHFPWRQRVQNRQSGRRSLFSFLLTTTSIDTIQISYPDKPRYKHRHHQNNTLKCLPPRRERPSPRKRRK